MSENVSKHSPDLWSVAVELTITPRGEDTGSRGARRAAAARRRRTWWWLGGSTAVAIGAGTCAILLHHPIASSVLAVVATLGITVASAAGMVQLRARAYRRFTSRMRRGAAPLWWIFTMLAWFALTSAGIVAVVSVSSGDSFGRSLVAVKLAALLLGITGLLLSAASSSAAPPLLSASPKPRPYQAHWSQLTWSAALVVATICITSLLLFTTQHSWVVEVTVTIGFAVVAALLAWHARALHNLRDQRAKLLDALVAALTAVTAASDQHASATSALLALRTTLLPGPFRSQSPAAPPAAAGWEITEVIAVALHASGYGDMPESITTRALLEDDLGAPFRAVVDADRPTLNDAVQAFLVRSIEWLR